MFWPTKHSRQNRTMAPELGPPRASLLSDPGCHRELNEDSGLVVHVGNGKRGDRGVLVVVADGMGGHQAGEVASRTAVDMIEKTYREAKGTPGEALAEAFRRAHRRILQMARTNTGMSGMGTTCTAVAVVGAEAWAAHVGDSRLYLVRGEEIYQLSEDQTQCMDLVRRGLITIEEARRHEDRNVLIQAMGTKRDLSPTIWSRPMSLKPGDALALCSDGLHDLVSDAEIRDAVRDSEPREVCRRLVALARERGGYDNITVAVVAVPSRGGESLAQKATRQYEVNG